MRRLLIMVLTVVAALAATVASAQAVVVDRGTTPFGVSLVPSTRDDLASAGITPTSWNTACSDPWLSSDLGGPSIPTGSPQTPPGLCWHGGQVIHSNETFDLAWDPMRRDWSSARYFVEQFLRNVADGSGTLTSPYALTAQYHDTGGRAANASLYGGGCIDYGSRGGSTCQFGNTDGSGPGNDYPSGTTDPSTACPTGITGTNYFAESVGGGITASTNDVCLNDGQIRTELATMISQEGLAGHVQSGYTPLLVLMTPPGVVDCLDEQKPQMCSANGTVAPPQPTVSSVSSGGSITAGTYDVVVTYQLPSGESVASAPQQVTTTTEHSVITISAPPALADATGWYAYVSGAGGSAYFLQGGVNAFNSDFQLATPPATTGQQPPVDHTPSFCSYHAELTVGGTTFPYVVLPWTALTACDEPDTPKIPDPVDVSVLADDVGARLVNSLTDSAMAAIVNPGLDGWSTLNGQEIDDDACVPLEHNLDQVTVGNAQYFLQREFNNGGVLVTDPNSPYCAGLVRLQPTFVVPSTVERGDVVEFDGSKTVSTLVVPRAGYVWDFGDGTTAIGPSVEHAYAYGGTYTVKLTVTDRGGYVASVSQNITVSGPPKPGGPAKQPKGPKPPGTKALKARIQLIPQGLGDVLRNGVAARVTSNVRASGFVTLVISRSDARKAHIAGGRRSVGVVVGRGTVSQIKAGTAKLHFRLSSAVVAKLRHLRHVAVTVRLALVTRSGAHLTVDAAGRY